MNWQPYNSFSSKSEKNDLRLGDHFQSVSQKNLKTLAPGYVLCGYPDDEGISLNGGRVGAEKAPYRIRDFLYKMCSKKELPLYDLGDFQKEGLLETRHEEVKNTVKNLLSQHRVISLGGGHDYAYPDGAGFLENYPDAVILNFDAHLDVRSLEKGLTSGTPFFRLITDYSGFELNEIGVQKHCNSENHFEWCKKHKITVLTFEDFLKSSLSLKDFVMKNLKSILGRPVFLSVDIDAFSSSYAMGASQSWPTGFEPHSFFELFSELLKTTDVRLLGIYEVSPPLDSHDLTSKLAAQIVYRFLYPEEFL